MKKACSIFLSLLLCVFLQIGVFAESTTLSTVVPSTHEITVSFNYGGYILKDGTRLTNGETFTVNRFDDVTLNIACLKDSHLKKVTNNGVDVTDQVLYGQLKLEDIATDMDIVFTFEKCEDADHGGTTDPTDPNDPTDPDDPTNPGGPTDPSDPGHDHDGEGDPCTHMGMSGNVFNGDDPFPNAHLDINFGDIATDADDEGQYEIDDIKDGFYYVEISDEDGNVVGSTYFSVTTDPNATEVTVVVLEDGTQLVIVPENYEHLYLDFIVNADGSVTVVPGSAPKEPGTDVGTPNIPITGALIMQYPLISGGIFLFMFFLILFIIIRRRDEEEEEEPARV